MVVLTKPLSVHTYSKVGLFPRRAQLTICAPEVMQELGYGGLLVGDTKAVK